MKEQMYVFLSTKPCNTSGSRFKVAWKKKVERKSVIRKKKKKRDLMLMTVINTYPYIRNDKLIFLVTNNNKLIDTWCFVNLIDGPNSWIQSM